ncbi:hypothetical protein HPB52_004017 [Rhipicephalus sanguineus]|uniref:Uncharacterized protein n=1 Tax=Rhipicephalus sanguineus TaxID=34632 RepID=A0A9D4PHS2_RHISA|nr:hypothetical protein HPB52_004017 [Rhipicephalus sanguineus]
MPKVRPANPARSEKAPGASYENYAVQRARRRPFLVRFLRRAITRKAVVSAVPLIVIVQVLYVAKGEMGVFKVKHRTSVIQDRSHRAWFYFRHNVGVYNRTRLLPSLEWAHFRKTPGEDLNGSQARSLNRTLVNTGMTGLSMLNVLADVKDLRSLSRALATMARTNQGMFLALGLRLMGLLDSTATSIVPSDVLDALLTPLSLFVLETHLPVPEETCVTAPLMPLFPYGSQPRPTLTFRGVKAFFSQPAVRLIHPNATGRCVSFLSGAVQFHVVGGNAASTDNASNTIVPTKTRGPSQPRHLHRPGEPCHSWSLVPVQYVCGQTHVTHITDAVAWYASSEGKFIAYDTWETFFRKARHVLMDHLESEIPTCLALYSVDLTPPRWTCAPYLHSSRGLLYVATARILPTIRAPQVPNVFQD